MSEEVEVKYPIYVFGCRWLEPVPPDYKPNKWQIENAPENKMWNSISAHYKAFKKEPKNNELDAAAREWWNKSRYKETAELPVILIRFVENETWWITWFQHETFDVGQSDDEALASFERYVRRKKEQARREHKDLILMGAEDRYRWHGAEPDGKPENRSEPPCRCKYCKEQGLIRIAH